MNIIISGCLGHIGSRLTRHLTEKHYSIIGIDNLSTQRYGSLRGLIGSNNFKFFNEDLSKINQSELSNLINKKDIGAWIHLAATTDAADSFDFKNELFMNNLKSTRLAIDFCKDNGLHFIFPSSTSVYGSAESKVDESSDKFLNQRNFSKVREGDYVAITNVGAYGISLASNYNTRPIVAEILVAGSKHKLIKKRQSFEKNRIW